MKRTRLILIILTVASLLEGQQLTASCSTAIHRQLDFLVGNWVVRDRSGRVLGTDSVSKNHGGCSLIELWREAGTGREGLGVMGYQPENGAWHELLMIRTEAVLSLDGKMDGDSMVMTGKEYPGRGVTRIHRIRWTPTRDGVEQLWQSSIDDGQSWQVHFEGVFQRVSE